MDPRLRELYPPAGGEIAQPGDRCAAELLRGRINMERSRRGTTTRETRVGDGYRRRRRARPGQSLLRPGERAMSLLMCQSRNSFTNHFSPSLARFAFARTASVWGHQRRSRRFNHHRGRGRTCLVGEGWIGSSSESAVDSIAHRGNETGRTDGPWQSRNTAGQISGVENRTFRTRGSPGCPQPPHAPRARTT